MPSPRGFSDERAQVLSEIEALFSWNPPRLVHAPVSSSKEPSATTRPSAFYDKHFSDHLVLKRVARLPSLVQDLAKNVDKALDAALETLPSLDGFVTAKQRQWQIRSLSKVVRDKRAVANFYDKTTATCCLHVASTLALHPTASFSQWLSLLVWTQSGPSPVYASMDGVLCFIEEGFDEETKALRAAIIKSMESENRLIFEKIRDSELPLATWEIKSTSACPAEVMTAVPNLGKFSWTICAPCIIRGCSPDPKYEKEMAKVEKVIVGPDARAPSWNLPDDSLNISLVPDNRDEQIDIQLLAPHIDTCSALVTRRVTRSATRLSASLMLPSPPPSASRSSEHGSLTKDKGKKRKREPGSPMLPLSPPSASHSSEHGSPMKNQGKRCKRDNDNDNDEAYQDRHDMNAQSLVQQAWAQAVRVNGTIIVLHSGNHELVCVRHRGSQTLYVSDVIEPPTCIDPGYGKLHVGIYIAAIQDMMDREQQYTSQPNPPGNGGDLIGHDKDQDDQDHNRSSVSGRKDGHGHRRGKHEGGHGVGKKGPTDEQVAIERTIHVASNRNVVLLYLQYNVYESQTPASLLRSAPSIMTHTRGPIPPRANRTYGLEECLVIVLTSEIGWGATGVVHRGTLKPEILDGAMPLDVVVKLAFDTEQRDALRSEYEIYRCLRSKGVLGGIVTVLGFFDDFEDDACALVMLYAGVPLVTESQRLLSVSDRKSALSTLESIHRAGILHGDIRRENILMGDSGVTIIDFGHSKQSDDQKAKDKEFAQLRYFLDLAHERR